MIQGAKATLKRDAEYAALAEKVKEGTATDEVLRHQFRPQTSLAHGGSVRIVGAPELTPEQWKALRPRVNAVAREQAAKRREEEAKSNA